MIRLKLILGVFVVLLLQSCVSSPPKNTSNICDLFKEKRSWYRAAKKAEKRWGTDIGTSMAIIYQESRFISRAKPPRKKILGFIPGPRPSTSYGYSQAKTSTWEWYQDSTGHYRAKRNDFADAIDFVGWYNYQSKKILGLPPTDAYSLYLAYHEGHGGYRSGSYKKSKKAWLRGVASKVSRRAKRYDGQLESCEKDLQSPWWWPF